MPEPSRPLTPVEAAGLLRAVGEAVRAEVSGLPPATLRWHPAPGGWCALEVVGHLIEAEERGFAGRVRQLLVETDPVFRTWDQAAVARARGDCERDPGALFDDFHRRRAASVALVGGLTAADLSRAGRHPDVGRLRISDLLAEWIHHDRAHLGQLLQIVQAFVWPHMGNAQRFSQP